MAAPKNSRQAWVVVVLLAIFMLINTADRAALGLAGPKIMAELQSYEDAIWFRGLKLLFSLFSLGRC